jgi:hypothetical protein
MTNSNASGSRDGGQPTIKFKESFEHGYNINVYTNHRF